MRILEARDGYVKIESESNLPVSSFVQINGTDKCYVAQVIQTKNSGTAYSVYAKILFLYDGSLLKYDMTLPDNTSEIEIFPYELLSKTINVDKPFVIGKFVGDSENIFVDKSVLNNNLLVSLDSQDNVNNFINNSVEQLKPSNNVLVIDMLGIYSGEKYAAGKDFKLPLNLSSLAFMYEDCLNDATSESKSLIKEIFADLAEYSKTVPFVPFSALKTIVDDMVENSHIFKLLVLKNKLAKFDKLGYFASKPSETEVLTNILNQNATAIDISKIDLIFQNKYLEYMYSELSKFEKKPQVFVIASNAINKKALKTIITNEEISSVFVSNSRFKYINEIKSFFKNFVIESNLLNQETFKLYTPFLNSIGQDKYLFVGEATNFIPLVSTTERIEIIPETIVSDSLVSVPQEIVAEEKDEQIEAIEKKSEELIEKVTEEIESSECITADNLFTQETETKQVEDEAESQTIEEVLINDEYVAEPLPEFHTNVDTTVSMEEELQQANNENGQEYTEPAEYVIPQEEIVGEDEVVATESELPEKDDFIDGNQPVTEEVEVIEEVEEVVIDDGSLNDDVINDVIEMSAQEPVEVAVEPAETDEYVQIDEPEVEPENIVEPLPVEDEQIIPEEQVEEQLISENTSAEEFTEDNSEPVIDDNGVIEEPLVVEPVEEPLNKQDDLDDDAVFDEIAELVDDESAIPDDAVLVDITDEPAAVEEENLQNEELEQEIIQDVDKVYTTMKEDTISDSDLDFIDELNDVDTGDIALEDISTDDNGLEEISLQDEDADESFLQPLEEVSDVNATDYDTKDVLETRESTTGNIPLYDADIPSEDKVESDPIAQGDTVTHAKYGTGVVEKMIKYGAKELYSINFDNVGRRLLDPTLTEIKKA